MQCANKPGRAPFAVSITHNIMFRRVCEFGERENHGSISGHSEAQQPLRCFLCRKMTGHPISVTSHSWQGNPWFHLNCRFTTSRVHSDRNNLTVASFRTESSFRVWCDRCCKNILKLGKHRIQSRGTKANWLVPNEIHCSCWHLQCNCSPGQF